VRRSSLETVTTIKVECGIRNFVASAVRTTVPTVTTAGGRSPVATSPDVEGDAAAPAAASSPASAAPPAEPAGPARGRELGDRTLALVTAAVTLPILWMGYGTDIDVTDVLASGDSIRAGDYAPSRPPGVPVFEAIVAVLDPVGGHLLVNLATAAAGAAAVIGIARLVRAWGHANGDLVALAFLAAPVSLIAATSTGDFMWAAAFFVWGALAHVRDRPVVAGALFGLAIGCRLSTVALLAAFLVADGWDPRRRRACVRTLAVALPLGALLYVPPWLAFDRSFELLESPEGWRSLANNLGRFAYKNYVAFGGAALVVFAVAAPALVAALRRWSTDPMVRVGALGFAVAQGFYLVYPWKFAHLIPALLMILLLVGASTRNRRPFLLVLIAALAVNGVVTFRPLSPDRPAEATTGEWNPAVTAGLLVNDVACRLDVLDDPLEPLNAGAWSCSLKPMRGDMSESPPDDEDGAAAGRDQPGLRPAVMGIDW
jgi:hypothetical protein